MLLGLTASNGTPIICTVIFVGIRITPLYETGMDVLAEVEGNACKDDLFDKKIGPGKLYPDGPNLL